MARPIKETPILYGEDARRFIEHMNNLKKETPEERAIREECYQAVLEAFKRGEQSRKEGRIPSCLRKEYN
jgi:hypothetical protein